MKSCTHSDIYRSETDDSEGEQLLSDTVYFLSDAHFKYHKEGPGALGPDEKRKRALFREFLLSIRGASRLYLVGDIFDFWFERRGVVPDYYGDILEPIGMLAAGGTGIFITGGNHDYWFDSYITDNYGVKVLPPVTIHEIQGLSLIHI